VPQARKAAAMLLALFCTACAGAGSGQTSEPTTATQSATATQSVVASQSAQPSASGIPAEYATSEFQPSFVVTLPGGWVVAERAADVAQIYQSCSSCLHGGEENGEITIDLTSADMTVDEAIAVLQTAANLQPGEVAPVEVGELSGLMFSGTRRGPSDVSFQPSGYHSGPFGEPIDVYALTFGGQTATVFVDPHDAEGAAAEAFREAATQILESLHIAP
jgi:hypothetical protein